MILARSMGRYNEGGNEMTIKRQLGIRLTEEQANFIEKRINEINASSAEFPELENRVTASRIVKYALDFYIKNHKENK